MQKLLFFFISFYAFGNPNTQNKSVKMSVNIIKEQKVVGEYELLLILEMNPMEERCYLKVIKGSMKKSDKDHWDCLFRSDKLIPYISKNTYVEIITKTLIVPNEEVEIVAFIEGFKSAETSLFKNSSKIDETYFPLSSGKFEISVKNEASKEMSYLKSEFEITQNN